MEPVPSDALVFFGASGDLAFKQIFPALLGLVGDEGVEVPIVGVAKAGWTVDDLKARAKASVESHGGADSAKLARLLALLRYVDGDYNDPGTFAALKQALGPAKRPLHYLAIPPSLFGVVVAALAASGLNVNARLVVEKPFGRDRESAQALNRTLHQHFPESAIYRIDHYLGKEPVQSIVYTRFANAPFESLWNRTYVRSIQITMAEAFGVDDRGSFYDATGALRDVVQNHMLQVLANVMMDPPTGEDHESMRDQKAALLKAVKPLDAASIVRGQYRGYRQVKGVRPDSTVETYVAVKLSVELLALGGRPDLHPRRQMPAFDGCRGHRRIQAAATGDVRRRGQRAAELHARADKPGCRSRDWLAGKTPRRRDDRRQRRAHAVGTRRLVDPSLSASARRRDARQRRVVRTRRRDRCAVADRPADP